MIATDCSSDDCNWLFHLYWLLSVQIYLNCYV